MNDETLFVDKEDSGQRLDLYLKQKLPYSRTYFQKLIEQHLVLVNGQIIKKRVLVEEGDEIEIEFALTEELSIEPEDLNLPILYEDHDLLAINKPANCVVHPACGHPRHTVVNFLAHHLSLKKQESVRPGIVHRLDKDTTGILLCAKTLQSHEKLVELFSSRKIEKQYLAVCYQKPTQNELTTFISRHPKNRQKMAVSDKGKLAETRIELLNSMPPLFPVRLFPKTGRTHQLRVHLSYIQAPILGDSLYGNLQANDKFHAKRQLLHAYSLTFFHPFTQKVLTLQAPIPEDMQKYFPNFY